MRNYGVSLTGLPKDGGRPSRAAGPAARLAVVSHPRNTSKRLVQTSCWHAGSRALGALHTASLLGGTTGSKKIM
jgi:hypothetical protein